MGYGLVKGRVPSLYVCGYRPRKCAQRARLEQAWRAEEASWSKERKHQHALLIEVGTENELNAPIRKRSKEMMVCTRTMWMAMSIWP